MTHRSWPGPTPTVPGPTPAVGPPAGRYGRPVSARRVRLARLSVGLAAALGVAGVVWLGLRAGSDPATVRTVGFAVHDGQSVDLTFEVTKDPATAVDCQVRALSSSYGEVGVRTVRVGPAGTATVRVTESIRTSEEATTAIVEDCVPADN